MPWPSLGAVEQAAMERIETSRREDFTKKNELIARCWHYNGLDSRSRWLMKTIKSEITSNDREGSIL